LEIEGEGDGMRRCPFCEGSIEKERIEHVHRWKGHLYLLRNVPAEACQQCGEVFFGPEALKEIDNVVSKGRVPEGHVSVPVYSLP